MSSSQREYLKNLKPYIISENEKKFIDSLEKNDFIKVAIEVPNMEDFAKNSADYYLKLKYTKTIDTSNVDEFIRDIMINLYINALNKKTKESVGIYIVDFKYIDKNNRKYTRRNEYHYKSFIKLNSKISTKNQSYLIQKI